MAYEPIITDSEEWRDVPGYEGFYQASSFGRVRRLRTTVRSKHGSTKTQAEKILSGKPNRVVRMGAHRAVCLAFHGAPPFAEAQVAHADGTRTNNRPDNLRWVSAKENASDRKGHGRDRIGESSWLSKLTEDQIIDIRSSYSGRRGDLAVLARRYSVTPNCIFLIVKRRNWKHI